MKRLTYLASLSIFVFILVWAVMGASGALAEPRTCAEMTEDPDAFEYWCTGPVDDGYDLLSSPTPYVCSNGEVEQVFFGSCPNGWWVVRVLAG